MSFDGQRTNFALVAIAILSASCNTLFIPDTAGRGPPPTPRSTGSSSVDLSVRPQSVNVLRQELGFQVIRSPGCTEVLGQPVNQCDGFIYRFKILCPRDLRGSMFPFANATVIAEMKTGEKANARSDSDGIAQLTFQKALIVRGRDLQVTINGLHVVNVDPTVTTELWVPIVYCSTKRPGDE